MRSSTQIQHDAIAEIVAELASDSRLVHRHHEPALPPRFASQAVATARTKTAGLLPSDGLWSHQAEAIERIRAGESTVIATGTASGKSLCFQIPVIEAALGGGTALMIYPTKALAQDQAMSLARLGVEGVTAATYDGDCSIEERAWVRANANVILTNPEMLHNAILPGRGRWASFMRNLRVVVVDEMHVLRGVFGSNVAHLLRRLRRSTTLYGGAEPTFVFTSATIGDPGTLASQLSGVEVGVVKQDGSPRGERDTIIWNPADTDGRIPLALTTEAAAMASRLVRGGLRTLVFCGSRRSTEVTASLVAKATGSPDAVRSYRGGYLAEERRAIEHELFEGKLRCVVSTSALELGVDIAGLDAVVMAGYPGTVASLRQQLGRSGRNAKPSLAVLIAGDNQLDQWVCAHPNDLFERPAEPATISLDNEFIYVPQIGCAAYESPLVPADAIYWPTQLDEAVRALVQSDRAHVNNQDGIPSVGWIGRGSPAPSISLRSSDGGQYQIVCQDGPGSQHLIGTVSAGSLYSSTHLGAVYLHQGVPWRVTGIDHATRTVIVEGDPGDTYTLPRSTKGVSIRSVSEDAKRDGWTLAIGDVEVSTHVSGYQIRSVDTHEILGREPLDVPDTVLSTRGIWYSISDRLLTEADIDPSSAPGALHAAEHAAIGMLPLFAICDRWDVGGLSTDWLTDTQSAAIVIHDSFPGGTGMAEKAFEEADSHLQATLDVLLTCSCSTGCPRCVQSPKCGNGNEPLDKAAATRLLERMRGRSSNPAKAGT